MKIVEFNNNYKDVVNNFLVNICVGEFGYKEWEEELITTDREEYKKNGGNFWMALDENNQIIGTIGLVKINDEICELKSMYVNRFYRGQNVAKELIEKFLIFARQNNYKKIQLGTYQKLERAVAFYKKYGFILKEKIDDVLFLEKKL